MQILYRIKNCNNFAELGKAFLAQIGTSASYLDQNTS